MQAVPLPGARVYCLATQGQFLYAFGIEENHDTTMHIYSINPARAAKHDDALGGREEPRFVPSGVGGGGAFYAPSLHPTEPGDVFVRSDMSGCYRSTDDGGHWTLYSSLVMAHCTVFYTPTAGELFATIGEEVTIAIKV